MAIHLISIKPPYQTRNSLGPHFVQCMCKNDTQGRDKIYNIYMSINHIIMKHVKQYSNICFNCVELCADVRLNQNQYSCIRFDKIRNAAVPLANYLFPLSSPKLLAWLVFNVFSWRRN